MPKECLPAIIQAWNASIHTRASLVIPIIISIVMPLLAIEQWHLQRQILQLRKALQIQANASIPSDQAMLSKPQPESDNLHQK